MIGFMFDFSPQPLADSHFRVLCVLGLGSWFWFGVGLLFGDFCCMCVFFKERVMLAQAALELVGRLKF